MSQQASVIIEPSLRLCGSTLEHLDDTGRRFLCEGSNSLRWLHIYRAIFNVTLQRSRNSFRSQPLCLNLLHMPRRVDAAGNWEKFSGNNRNMQHLQLHLHVLAGGGFFHWVLQWSTKVTLYSCLVVCSVMWLLYGQCHEILRMQGEQEIVETLWGYLIKLWGILL